MSNQEITHFIDYLEFYKKIENANLADMYNLMYTINNDYYKNKYFLPFYVGDSKIFKLYCQNNTIPVKYEIPPQPIVKIKVEINVDINKLSDLLNIIDTYPYKDTEEYNIDLKSLTNIKTELQQINEMIGMESLKTNILNQLLYFLQNLHINTVDNISSEYKHTVIYGPPGTGKTEVAKLIGKMYSKIGILNKNVFKKVTRGDLVAGYLGQTAIKTKNVITEALGGVLFIDEAYSLANGKNDLDNFSKECIDTLCEALSDHRDNLMVIIAGYEDELNDCFFSANRGLESRFIWRFKIEEYNAKEMFQIFMKKIQEIKWEIDPESKITYEWFEKNKSHFLYFGRDIELLLSYTKIMHSKRIFGKPKSQIRMIHIDDLNAGLTLFNNNKKEKKSFHFLHSLYV